MYDAKEMLEIYIMQEKLTNPKCNYFCQDNYADVFHLYLRLNNGIPACHVQSVQPETMMAMAGIKYIFGSFSNEGIKYINTDQELLQHISKSVAYRLKLMEDEENE